MSKEHDEDSKWFEPCRCSATEHKTIQKIKRNPSFFTFSPESFFFFSSISDSLTLQCFSFFIHMPRLGDQKSWLLIKISLLFQQNTLKELWQICFCLWLQIRHKEYISVDCRRRRRKTSTATSPSFFFFFFCLSGDFWCKCLKSSLG